ALGPRADGPGAAGGRGNRPATEISRRRPHASVALRARDRSASLQPAGRSALAGPGAAGHKHRADRLYGLASRASAAGTTWHQLLDDRTNAAFAGGRPAGLDVQRTAAANHRRWRVDSAAHLFGAFGRRARN